MSERRYHRCPYCRHMIKDKFILGTFHFCLLPEERDEIDRRRGDAMRQYREQRASVASPELYRSTALESAIQAWRMKD